MYTYTDIYNDIYSTTSPIIMIFGLSKFALSIRVLENVNFNFDYITRDGSEKVEKWPKTTYSATNIHVILHTTKFWFSIRDFSDILIFPSEKAVKG